MSDYKGLKTKLMLPFSISAEDRIKAFTKDMEIAAILYLAESDREKGEGHILKKQDEKLVFIAEVCYPIWLVPWSEGTLLFDGLGVTAHTLSYDILTDIKAFNNDIQMSAKKSEAYSAALSRNANYFKNFAGKEEKTIEGLITNPDFIQDFFVYLSEGKEVKKQLTTKAVLSPIINKSEISASIEELSKIGEDVKNVEASMKLLSTTTRKRVKAIREEIKKVRKNFARKIENVKPRVTRKIRQIQKKYDEKIIRTSKRFERRLQLLHEDQVKLKKMQRHLRAEINRCEVKIKSCKRQKNKESEIQWTLNLKKIRKRLPALKRKISGNVQKIEKLETAKKLETSKQRMECDVRIERATKNLKELKASLEAGIRMLQQKITSLEDTTSLIINQMNEMAESKKAALTEFDRISIPKRKRAYSLVYLPFYIARYEMEAKKRYILFPPSIVGDMGILTKMKGVLGAAKMKAFLQPRSKSMTDFLNQLITLIQKNPMFEKEITTAGIQNSILRIKELRIDVKRGLKKLEDEKWVSKNELQTFSKLLYIYAGI